MSSSQLAASSSTYASSNAPEHQIPSERFYCVDFPGYVKESSVSRAVEHLGGQDRLNNAFKKNASKVDSLMELSWRPEDPFAHPIQGSTLYANNLLLKIKKRKRRKVDGAEVSGYKGDFTAEVIGVVPKTVRFRHMADFQYAPEEADPVIQLRKAMDRMDVEYIKEYAIPPEKEDYELPLENEQLETNDTRTPRSNLRLPPPPLFSPQGISQIYNYKANSHSVLTTYVDNATGEEKKRLINRARWKGFNAVSTNFSSKNVPVKPPPAVEAMAREIDKRILARLRELFEERPIWTREALNNQFSASDVRELTNQKFIIPFVSYSFNDGPWRDTFIRLGYDPRLYPETRFYQRLYFRNVLHPLVRPSIVGRSTQQRNSEQVVSPAPDPQSSNEQSDEAPPSHIFDGKHQTKDTAAYQLCDIVDPMLKAMIEDESSVRDECNERNGWYTTHSIEHIKIVLRHKFFSILEGHIPSDEECQVLLDAGDTSAKHRDTRRVNIRKHNMAKGAVPPEDAAAMRLRATLDNHALKAISARGR